MHSRRRLAPAPDRKPSRICSAGPRDSAAPGMLSMTSRPWPWSLLLILISICGAAQAQSVGAVGIPLGSTELGVQGLSPLGAAASPGSAATGSAACPGIGAAAGQSPAPLFDGGGIGTSGSAPCAAGGDLPPAGSSFTAAGSGAPPRGGTGIPLGSVETAPAGLSSPPAVPAVPSSVPSPVGGTQPCMSVEIPMPAGSC